jgi:hypothetical protein
MTHHYENGQRIVVGDQVIYGGHRGRVIFIIEEGAYATGVNRTDWLYRKNGIGIQLGDGTLYILDTPDEDLEQV